MAVIFQAEQPSDLLATFKRLIDECKVVTWAYDGDGDFTHTPPQWKDKAWLRPRIGSGSLTLVFLGNTGVRTSSELYAIMHGRFIEAMLAHCDAMFSSASASFLPEAGDAITSNVA